MRDATTSLYSRIDSRRATPAGALPLESPPVMSLPDPGQRSSPVPSRMLPVPAATSIRQETTTEDPQRMGWLIIDKLSSAEEPEGERTGRVRRQASLDRSIGSSSARAVSSCHEEGAGYGLPWASLDQPRQSTVQPRKQVYCRPPMAKAGSWVMVLPV